MSELELFERVLEALHEAAFDDARWPVAASLIDEACGSKGNFLVTGDGAVQTDIDIFFARFCYRGQRREDLERLYFGTYHALDERVPRIRQLPDGRVVHNSSLYTDDEKNTSPAYNEALLLAHNRDGLSVRLDGPEASRIVWAIADPVTGDGWSTARLETIGRLLPHLRQFVRVRHALVNAKALGSTAMTLLENTRSGVIQLDRRGRIVAVNDRARSLLRAGDGLADRSGFLCAISAEDDAALQKLLAKALPPFGTRGKSGSMTAKRPAVSPRLVLHVTPVGRRGTDMRPSRVAALALVVDPASRSPVDPDLVGAALGLTPAESHVAVLLAQGRTVGDIAITTGRHESTVRWHVKEILRKQGFSRQMELVQLVSSLPDFPQPQD